MFRPMVSFPSSVVFSEKVICCYAVMLLCCCSCGHTADSSVSEALE